MNYAEESSSSGSSESAHPASPPPGSPSEESGLNPLRALTDQVASEHTINQLADRLNASFGNQDQIPEQVQGARMANYDETTGTDGANALEKSCSGLKGYDFDEQDLGFYFNQVELQMRQNGVKKNYTKFLVLTAILPAKVRDQVKALLRKQESEYTDANQQPYKILKEKILKIYRPPQESRFERAMSRVLSGKPSELARALVSDLCDHELVGCCCGHIIVGFWKRQLPLSVRQAIASEEFNADTFDQVVQHADDVMNQTKMGLFMSPGVSALSGAVSLPAPQVFDEAFHEEWPNASQQQQVAAFGYSRGRGGNRGGRGQGRGQRGGRGNGRGSGFSRGGGQGGQNGQGSNQGQGQGKGNSHPRHKTQRHPDSPPFQSCFRHWTFGKSAHFCMEPGTCPWKDFYVPKPNQ